MYKPTRFTLWKEFNNKWCIYGGGGDRNSIFPIASGDKGGISSESLRFQQGLRLMEKGWLPYAIGTKPPQKPLDSCLFESTSTQELETLISDTERVSPRLKMEFRDFFARSFSSNEIPPKLALFLLPSVAIRAREQALLKAEEDLKAGRFVPPYLLARLENVKA